jgi:hypothetical protein
MSTRNTTARSHGVAARRLAPGTTDLCVTGWGLFFRFCPRAADRAEIDSEDEPEVVGFYYYYFFLSRKPVAWKT